MGWLDDARMGLAVALAGRKALGPAAPGVQPAPWWGPLLAFPNSRRDWAAEAGDVSLNSAVMACIGWIRRNITEAPATVYRVPADGSPPEQNRAHPLVRLLRRPNPFYSGRLLWQATAADYNLHGNAYWLKTPSTDQSHIMQLWYEPRLTIRAVTADGSRNFIDAYEVWRRGQWVRVESQFVVHFRNGLDPDDARYGLSPLRPALREIFTDNEAAAWTANLLRNSGVPPVLISPKPNGMAIPDVQETKRAFLSKTTGDARGEPLVMEFPVDVQQMGIDPASLDLKAARRVPEERISGLLNLPAIVAKLGAGLDSSTYNNTEQAREEAYEGNIVPTLLEWADTLTVQLLPDFPTTPEEEVGFDFKQVRVLQDDENRKASRWAVLYNSGIAKRSEGRKAFDLPVDAADETYKQASSAGAVPGGGAALPPVPVSDGGLKALTAPTVPARDATEAALGQAVGVWLASAYVQAAQEAGQVPARNGAHE